MTLEFDDYSQPIGVALNKTTDVKVMMHLSARDIGLPKEEYGDNPIITVLYSTDFDNDGPEARLWTLLPFKQEILQNNGFKQGKYRHFKGMPYEVLGIAFDLEQQKKTVLYSPLYDVPGLYDEYGNKPISTQLYEKFFEDVTRDGITKPRFEYIG